jgi:transcriptional regulator with XRE-family HTH domain
MNQLKSYIGSEIRRVRKEKKISQVQLSESSGISQTYISEIESGKRLPTLNVLHKLTKGIGAKCVISIQN